MDSAPKHSDTMLFSDEVLVLEGVEIFGAGADGNPSDPRRCKVAFLGRKYGLALLDWEAPDGFVLHPSKRRLSVSLVCLHRERWCHCDLTFPHQAITNPRAPIDTLTHALSLVEDARQLVRCGDELANYLRRTYLPREDVV